MEERVEQLRDSAAAQSASTDVPYGPDQSLSAVVGKVQKEVADLTKQITLTPRQIVWDRKLQTLNATVEAYRKRLKWLEDV
jgi:hypothetical protein